jgi:hypothetical protein
MFKQNKGITLVALVITIIVLLILAGVSISLVLGDNGIATRAINAADKTEYAQIKEAVELAITDANSAYWDVVAGATTTGLTTSTDAFTAEYVAKLLNESGYALYTDSSCSSSSKVATTVPTSDATSITSTAATYYVVKGTNTSDYLTVKISLSTSGKSMVVTCADALKTAID